MKTSFENQENRKSRVSAALTQGVAQAVQAAELVLPMVDLREKGLPPGFQAAQPLRRGRFQIGRRLLRREIQVPEGEEEAQALDITVPVAKTPVFRQTLRRDGAAAAKLPLVHGVVLPPEKNTDTLSDACIVRRNT